MTDSSQLAPMLQQGRYYKLLSSSVTTVFNDRRSISSTELKYLKILTADNLDSRAALYVFKSQWLIKSNLVKIVKPIPNHLIIRRAKNVTYLFYRLW